MRFYPLLVLLASWASPVHGQTLADSAGIVITRDTVDPGATLALDRIARIGNALDDPDHLLASAGPLAVDLERGEVFVLDGLDRRVKVFSLDGTLLRAWGRAGEGPGEFAGSMGMAVARDTVIISDGTRVHTFRRNGEHLHTIVPRGKLPITLGESVAAWSGGWWFTQREIQSGVTGSNPFRRTYSLSPEEGIGEDWVYQEPWPGPGPTPILAHSPNSAFHRDGFIDAPSGVYEIRVTGPDASLLRVLRFADEPVPVPSGAKREYEQVARERCRDHPSPAWCNSALEGSLREVLSLPLPETRPVIGRLVGSRTGLILAQRTDLDPDPFRPGGETRWDLVSDSGKWLGRIHFPDTFDPRWLGEDQVWGIERDELDVPYVVGYRLTLEARNPERGG